MPQEYKVDEEKQESKDKTKKEEHELRERFHTDLEHAKKFTDPFHQQMDKHYEMYRNRWSEDESDFHVSDLYEYVETVVPILTNNRVRGSVHSDYPDYTRHAQAISDILDHTFDVNDWDHTAQKVARMAEIYRSCLVYTGYDPDAKNGIGQLSIKNINGRWCYFDPGPQDFKESGFFFYVEPRRVTEVVAEYPKKKRDIEETIGKKEGSMHSDKQRAGGWFKSWIRSFKNMVNFNDDNTEMNNLGHAQFIPEMEEQEKRKNNVAFIHYWYRDDEDKWRVSYWADDLLLEDIDNPFWHGELPYDIYNPTDDPLSSLGVPIAEHIEKLNWEKNVLIDLVKQSARRAANPPMLYNTTGGFGEQDARKMKEMADVDGIIPINNPDMVPLSALAEYMQSPTMNNFIPTLLENLSVELDRKTGVNDSFRGLADATSGKEVQLKQEAAYNRIKTKVDNFESFVKSMSGKIIINAMQFYNEWRPYRIKGDYQQYQDIDDDNTPFEVAPIQKGMDDQGEPEYDRHEFFLYANPHEWTKEVAEDKGDTHMMPGETHEEETEDEDITKEDVQEAFKILQFVVEIDAGSSLPTSRMARREEAAELFGAGVIDQQALLEAYDWKDRDEIMKRMGEMQKLQQENEMMQQELQKMQQMQQTQQQMPQQPMQAPPEMMQAPQAQQPPDMASQLDEIRAMVPEVAQMSDEELMQFLNNMDPQALQQMGLG